MATFSALPFFNLMKMSLEGLPTASVPVRSKYLVSLSESLGCFRKDYNEKNACNRRIFAVIAWCFLRDSLILQHEENAKT